MAGYLTTHVLDTAQGHPAHGMAVALWRVAGEARELLTETVTNADGRTDAPVLPEDAFQIGSYELVFLAGDYFRAQGMQADPLFLERIPIRFGMNEAVHYHVPLLLSPYGYSTYRGS